MRTATRLLLLLIDLASSGLHPSLGEIRAVNDLTSLCLKKSCSSPIICLFCSWLKCTIILFCVCNTVVISELSNTLAFFVYENILYLFPIGCNYISNTL